MMNDLLWVILLCLIAGMAMPVGAAFACMEHIQQRWLEAELRHGIIAFGGGALLSAVALVLVPYGSEHLQILPLTLCFIAGALAFMGLDVLLYRHKTRASQLAAMLSDFIPEAIALGALFALKGKGGLLLAMLMALQNLPEGFNAYREMKNRDKPTEWSIVGLFAAMALLGPVAGVIGYFWLSQWPQIMAGLMVFASGAILYSVFQDIAPQARLARHWGPPLGAVMGFLLGLVGHMMLTH